MLSVLGSVGFFSAIGVKSTLIIMEVIPFLVLAVSCFLGINLAVFCEALKGLGRMFPYLVHKVQDIFFLLLTL